MRPRPQGMPTCYGMLNSHLRIWRLCNVNWRTVQDSVLLGFLPVVHQKWNIRCSDLLHKELRAEIALVMKAWAQSLMSLWISPRFKVFTFSFPLSNTLSFWIQMFSNLAWIWLWGTTQCHVYVMYIQSSFCAQLHRTGTSSQAGRSAALGYGQGKREEAVQLTWDDNDPAVSKTRKGSLQKPHSGIFRALDQTPTSTYQSPKQNQKQNGQDTRQAVFTIISVYVKPRRTRTINGSQKTLLSSDLMALDIQINVWWALGSRWGSSDLINYLKFLYIYKNNHHRSRMRGVRQEIVLLFKFSSGHLSDHKIPCTNQQFPF